MIDRTKCEEPRSLSRVFSWFLPRKTRQSCHPIWVKSSNTILDSPWLFRTASRRVDSVRRTGRAGRMGARVQTKFKNGQPESGAGCLGDSDREFLNAIVCRPAIEWSGTRSSTGAWLKNSRPEAEGEHCFLAVHSSRSFEALITMGSLRLREKNS